MKNHKNKLANALKTALITSAFFGGLAVTSMAAEPTKDLETLKKELAQDKSGTNPLNFSYDARLYNEYQWLNVPGGGSKNDTTFEFRAPFADGKWQFRTRLRATNLSINKAGISEFGFGDMDMRFLTIPYVNMATKQAMAIGLEVFIPTGSNDAFSSNAFSFGPQVFYAFLAPFGGLVDLIAPGYQHQFSVYEESGASNVHLGLVDLFILKTFNEKQQWVMLNPQGILNYEAHKEWIQFDVEVGTMLKKKGHSLYARPSFGIGNDRSYDYSFEAGYKIVW